MSFEKIPRVKYVTDIQADNAGMCEDLLIYASLSDVVRDYARDNGRRIDVFWEAETDSVVELAKARQLGFEFFVATSDKVVSSGPQNRDLWADRYTNASIELFGAPEPGEATRIISHQLEGFKGLQGQERVSQDALQLILNEYESVIEGNQDAINEEANEAAEQVQQLALAEIGRVLTDRYAPVLDLVDESGVKMFSQQELVELFAKALEKLTEIDDEAWQDWKVISPEKGTSISVDGREQEVKIPVKRSPVDYREAKKLLAHELLIHGLRAKNARKSSDEQLLKGLPNYLEGEEGLAIIAGAAVSGPVSGTTYDRYIDIAFAAGIIGNAPKKRSELYELAYARRLVRAQADGDILDITEIKKKTSVYVDRIYRGSPGDDIGTRQAVYTADISYYQGFRKISEYIAEKLKEGQKMEDLFDYMMKGRFDPTNPAHIKRIAEIS